MKRASWLLLVLALSFVLALGVTACGDDDDPTTDGDSPDGDTPDGDENTGDPLSCTDPASGGFGGKKISGDCDNKVGVCENGEAVGPQEWYPCVEDPDCCCDSETPMVDDIYPCENDSCGDDGYCDDGCPDGVDPDC